MGLLSAFVWVSATALAPSAMARQVDAQKKIVHSDADLPRLVFPLSGSGNDLLVSQDATFAVFANKVGSDLDAVFAGYTIDDKSTMRKLLLERAYVYMVTGDPKDALATLDRIRDLEEKPEAKVASGLLYRAMLQAWIETGAMDTPAFHKAFAAKLAATVKEMPWSVAQEAVKGERTQTQILSPKVLQSVLKTAADVQAAQTHTVDLATASVMLHFRVALKFDYPSRAEILGALTPYIQAHTEQKPDIWAARDVTFTAADKLTPVNVGIWDSGVDTALFAGQLFTDTDPTATPAPHGAHGIAFDTGGKPYAGDLQPLTEEQKATYPKSIAFQLGIADMQSGVDSERAKASQKFMSDTPPAELSAFRKQATFLSQYMHGTHVAGIAVKGNPAARLVVVQFNDGLEYLPFAPTVEWAENFKADFAEVGDYLKRTHVRVVNMSWADSVSEFERWLARTSTEKDPEARKKKAAELYAIWKDAVEGAIKRAPDTLFVCAAGNSDSNAGFIGDVPASLKLPNLVTVGAVDQAGEETSFTSYGDTVVLHADGFQVESYVPGGTRMKFSGTSMASPNVVNLAAKLFALDPKLTPSEVVALIEKTADTSADGRRHLINPKAAIDMLTAQSKSQQGL